MAATGILLSFGAGASMPPPTLAPAFKPLMSFVLEDLGWKWKEDKHGAKHPHWVRPGYPDIDPPWEAGPAPEVVFRFLDELRIGFADPVEHLMTAVAPNAVHIAAATLLGRRRLRLDAEHRYRDRGSVGGARSYTRASLAALARDTHAFSQRRPPERSFADAGSGTLVKFHGSADARDARLHRPAAVDAAAAVSDRSRDGAGRR